MYPSTALVVRLHAYQYPTIIQNMQNIAIIHPGHINSVFWLDFLNLAFPN